MLVSFSFKLSYPSKKLFETILVFYLYFVWPVNWVFPFFNIFSKLSHTEGSRVIPALNASVKIRCVIHFLFHHQILITFPSHSFCHLHLKIIHFEVHKETIWIFLHVGCFCSENIFFLWKNSKKTAKFTGLPQFLNFVKSLYCSPLQEYWEDTQ